MKLFYQFKRVYPCEEDNIIENMENIYFSTCSSIFQKHKWYLLSQNMIGISKHETYKKHL